jgi:putative flippase GtrA
MFALKYYQSLREYLLKNHPNFFKYLVRFQKVIKYIITGSTATLINLFFLFIFYKILDFSIILSSTFAFILAFIFSFSVQKFWTFKNFSKKSISNQLIMYLLLALFSLLLNAHFMYLLVEKWHIWYLLAQIIVASFLAIFNFFAYKYLVFSLKN